MYITEVILHDQTSFNLQQLILKAGRLCPPKYPHKPHNYRHTRISQAGNGQSWLKARSLTTNTI